MTSTFSATPYSASSRACPGPVAARASTSQSAARSVVRIELTATGAVRAAAGLVISNARGTLELSFPANIGADLVGIADGHPEVRSARLQGGLDAGEKAPFAAEPELEAGPEVGIREAAEVLGAETSVEGHESFLAQLPAGRKLRHRRIAVALGKARPNFDEVQRNTQVLNQRAFQLTGEGAREIRQSACQSIGLAQICGLVGWIPSDQVGHQVGLRDRRVKRTLECHLRSVECARDLGDHWN